MEVLEWLRAEAESYKPNVAINERLAETVLIPVIGPMAVGKTTRIQNIVNTNPHFGRSVGFTTRPRRLGEPEDQYRFRSHMESSISDIADDVKNKRLVQYAVHPNGYIYGSEAEDYAHSYTMLDVVYSGVAPLRKLPVQSALEVSLVCNPRVWRERFLSRKPSQNDMRIRLTEGIASLTWSLDKDEAIWVDNTQPLNLSSDEIVDIALGIREPDSVNRRLGEQLLATIQQMLDS